MAEEPHNLSMSPYNYCINNPVLHIDPDGRDWYSYTQDGKTYTHWQKGSASVVLIGDRMYANMGETYTKDLGGGSSITYTQNEATSFTVNTADDSSWETSQTAEYGNCYKASSAMLKNEGVETGGRANEILVTNGTKTGRAGVASKDAQKGFNMINNTLDSGQPLMVGVDYKDGHPGNADKRTDHFIVIRGKTETLSNGRVTSTTYNYMDPGTSHRFKGTSSKRTLIENSNRLEGTHMNNALLKIVVTTVRPNKR